MSSPPLPSIQCSTGPFWTFELERAFDALAEAGFAQIELMVTRDPATQEPDLPLKLATERGIRIASVHGPFLAISKTVWGIDPLTKIKRGTEFCRAVGADTLVVHPPYLWERRYATWLKREAASFSADAGVAIAVETMYPKWVAGRRVRAYRWLEPAELYANCHLVAMDTSHLAVLRADILKGYQTLAPKLVHVHLSNNAGDGRDGHLEIEQGVLPIERLLEEMRRTRYAGAVSLELSTRRYLERAGPLVEMLRRNREFVEKRLIHGTKRVKGMPRSEVKAVHDR